MNFNIKALLVGAALILGMQGAAQAVSPETVAKLTQKFEFFNQLPKEVQAQIIGLLDAESLEESMKQLSRLRLVSKQMRDLIDNEYMGKQIIQMIAQRYPEKSTAMFVDLSFKQNLPSPYSLLYAWLKEQAKINPAMKEQLTYIINNQIVGMHRMVHAPLTQDESNKIKQLLSLGADVNFKMSAGWTLLTIAASISNLEAAQLFLDAGADVNYIKPGEGTALDIAEHSAPIKRELVELLKSRGDKRAAELAK